MTENNLQNSILSICDKELKQIIGTGFFINSNGHFITASHVMKYLNIEEDLICIYKKEKYNIRLISSLSNFYKLLGNEIKLDITILKIEISNPTFEVKWLPLFHGEYNNPINFSNSISFGCFFSKNHIPYYLNANCSILKYNESNSLIHILSSEIELVKSFSGSPLIDNHIGEVIGVMVQKDENNPKLGSAQSIHHIIHILKEFDYNFEHINGLFFEVVSEYKKITQNKFSNEEWPYSISKDQFIDCFDFYIGNFNNLKDQCYKNDNCVEIIRKNLNHSHCFCLGYYGMGKTTISKFLFEQINLNENGHFIPIYISLSFVDLRTLSESKIEDVIFNHLINPLKNEILLKKIDKFNSYIKEHIKKTIRDRKYILIFDGIDESRNNKEFLILFAKYLNNLSCHFFLTSRKEFFPFFDTFPDEFKKNTYKTIDLIDWNKKQWRFYIKNLINQFPDKKNTLRKLLNSFINNDYGSLPSRPLFLKMICDLNLNKETKIEKPPIPELLKNRSAIYYSYITWKLNDDYKRKGGKFVKEKNINRTLFIKEAFILLKRLAIVEHKESIPEQGAKGFLNFTSSQKSEIQVKEIYVGFNDKDIKELSKDLNHLNFDFIREYLYGSTFFSIIRSINDNDGFRFSHKSFSEYLVAYNLVDCVLGSSIPEAFCDETWSLYQSFEVSSHFKDELERIRLLRGLEIYEQNRYFISAFERELKNEINWKKYEEKIEEILYYSGKLKLDSELIKDKLLYLFSNPEIIDEIYFRTASIALSNLLDRKYCELFIEFIMDDYNINHFERNKDLQIGYYGKTLLRPKIKTDIDEFLTLGYKSNILSLKIHTYFTSLEINRDEKSNYLEYIKKIISKCEKENYSKLKDICKKLEKQIK